MDSLKYYIQTDDLLNNLKTHSSKFGFSKYCQNHPFSFETNKKIWENSKTSWTQKLHISLLVWSRRCMPSNLWGRRKKEPRGCQPVMSKEKYQDYVDCMQDQRTTFKLQKRIGQRSHRLFTIEQRKKYLNPFDDSHYKIKK